MKSKTVIAMDGATCVKAKDGNITFKKRTFTTWVIIVGLGLILLPLLGFMATALLSGREISLRGLITSLGGCAFLAIVIFTLIRNMRMPPVYINASSRRLEIGRGAFAREVLFSNIGYIILTSHAGLLDETITDVQALLKDGETIRFGSVSGGTAEARANAIAQLIADATGAPIHR